MPEEPGASVREVLDREPRRAADPRDPQRRAFDRPGDPVGEHEHRHGAALDQEHEPGTAGEHQHEAEQVRRQRQGPGDEGRGHPEQDLAKVAAEHVAEIAAEQRRDQERAADDRHGQEQLEGGVGDRLDGDDLPVGGRDQRATLECRPSLPGMRHVRESGPGGSRRARGPSARTPPAHYNTEAPFSPPLA
jgi:hypothetical protein